MKQVNSKLATMLATLGLVFMTGGTALADDTELFIAGEDSTAGPDAARPNIMFIIDTSGSMRSDVLTQVSTWDANLTFAGCYRSDAVYWSTGSQQPSCGSNNWFYKSRNYCADSQQALDNIGVYSGALLEWQRNNRRPWRSRWVNLTTSHNRNIECAADAGQHGQNTGNLWAADGQSSPWRGDDSREPFWGQNYTLYDGNYLNYLQQDGTVIQSRIDVVKDVTNQLLGTLQDVNVGLMRFNFDDGGPVIHAMEDITTARTAMQNAVTALPADGWTPLSETLYEAGQYFAGRSVQYGDGFDNESVAASRLGGTMSSGTYNSPIDFACQKNYIVLLSDGEPTQDTGAENAIENLPGFSGTVGPACARLPGVSSNDGKCLDEMADYLYNYDLSSDFYGQQNVTTYTIAFSEVLPLLEETARRGGGAYYEADDTSTLTRALTEIVVSILDEATTFAAPSVPVNAFNRTQNLEDVFVSVFKPSSTLHWPGNLKKYSLRNARLVDANDQLAVDDSTGFFTDTAQSFWSSAPDGASPELGGAAEQLPAYDSRNLYTNIAGGVLTSAANRIVVTNNGITGAMLGGASNSPLPEFAGSPHAALSERDLIVQWMRGLDVFDDNGNNDLEDTRLMMGDPLHVSPVPVIYGGTAENPDMVVYTATNNGYLHAIDPDDGSELWAFVPSRLLGNQRALFDDPVSPTRLYGLDGEITAAVLNDDKRAGISGSERVILVFGMRRGGDAYFAVDVTDRNNPELLWEIDSTTTGFDDLGQTWSTPQHARVRIEGGIKDVVFVAGGYDPGQDNESYRTDTRGNAVYMIDIETGDLLWSAGQDSSHDLVLPDMEHSIPAPLRVADLNADGLASRLYFGDMGGRVWRIDIVQGRSANDAAEGGVLAELGGAGLDTPTTADLRRFYHQADIVDVPNKGQRFLAVNIGSGYRAHPLDRQIDEYFFSIRDWAPGYVLETDSYPEPATFAELLDVDLLNGIDMGSAAKGWKLRMEAAPGEKVLGRSITFEGVVYFTSFAPGSGANACTAARGQNRLYAISLFNGEAVEEDTPYIELDQGGIAPEVQLFYVPPEGSGNTEPGQRDTVEGVLAACAGTECVDLTFTDPLTRSYWTQDGAQ